jgi:hypothetical protein
MNIMCKLMGIALLTYMLSGCAAVGTAVSHHNLETQTLMSSSMFINPKMLNQPSTIFLMLTNTTDHPDFTISKKLKEKIRLKGYQVVTNLSQASYILQVNVLQVGMQSETAAKEMMGAGYGGSLEGVVTGVAIAGAAGAATAGVVAGGIVGGVATSAADNFVKDVNYSVISDVQLIQIMPNGKYNIMKTRILSTANKVNLDFKEAMPILELGLSSSISGLFISKN